jgi:hypothetical protein
VHASGTLSRMITAHVDSAEQQLQVGRLRIVNILDVQLTHQADPARNATRAHEL